jgi:hypothetical protein
VTEHEEMKMVAANSKQEEAHMARWMKSGMKIAGLVVMMLALTCDTLSAQGEGVPLDLKNPPKKSGDFQWRVDQRLVQSLSKNTQTGAKAAIGGAGGFTGGVDNAIIAVLRKQSAAASSQIGSASQVELNPQPFPPKASEGRLGPGQTMSAPGQTGISTAPNVGMLAPQSGPVRHQSPGADRTQQPAAAKAPAPTQMCINGIATVDGQKSGVVFVPISGAEGTFVIQGCGFGTKAGEVYLSGLHYAPSASNPRRNIVMSADRLPLRISQNGFPGAQPGKGNWQLGWSDRQIITTIDPGASGYLDTDNISLVVKTASGQTYTAAGFRFFAAREQQKLTSIPTQAIKPGSSYDTAGHLVTAHVLSPAAASLVLPGHTVAVVRDDNSATFPGGSDRLDLSRSLAPGFQVTSVQQFNAALTSAGCQSVPPGGGHFTTNGSWNVTAIGGGGYMVLWQEQSCATQSTNGPTTSIGSVSAYALDITVIGPRGVNPVFNGVTLQVVN